MTRPSATVHVGLHVHAVSIRLAAVCADEVLDERTLPYDREAVARVLSRSPRVRCCHEAGPTGDGLAKDLRSRGIACDVPARGLVPVQSGDRVKTDRRDARKLARLHGGGLLESIAVSSEQIEALRDLSGRARTRGLTGCGPPPAQQVRAASRAADAQQVVGITRRRWLGSLIFEHAHQQQAFQTYLHALDLVDRRIEVLERELDAAAQDGLWRELVARLRCLRGVDTLTVLGLVAEIGTDWDRFRTAEQFRGRWR